MKLYRFLLFIILLAALVLRFFQFTDRYGMMADTSRDAIVAFESARQLQLPLTGSFSSIGPITFGPWYYWIITFSTFIIPSVWAPWITITMASWAMVFIMYKIGDLLENKNFGLLLAFISAFSPAQVSASSSLTQHSLLGFMSSLILYLFIKIIKEKKIDWFSGVWGFIIGVAINTHFQAVGLLTLPFLYLLFSNKRRFILPFMAGLFFSMIPILTFELNNHWFNTRHIIDYIFIGQYRVWTSNRWLTFAGKFIPDFWSYTVGTPYIISFIIMLTSGILLALRFWQKRLSRPLIIISLSFLIQIVMLRYYRGEKFFGYLQFFHPYIFIYTGILVYAILCKMRNSILIGLIVFLYSFSVISNTIKAIGADQMHKETSGHLVSLKKYYPNSKFAVYKCKNEDIDRIQALVLILYLNKLYDNNGQKVTIGSSSCNVDEGKLLDNKLLYLNHISADRLAESDLHLFTPLDVYSGTTRWWFKEQP